MSENFNTNNNKRNNTPSQMKETRYFTCYNVIQMKNENQVFPYTYMCILQARFISDIYSSHTWTCSCWDHLKPFPIVIVFLNVLTVYVEIQFSLKFCLFKKIVEMERSILIRKRNHQTFTHRIYCLLLWIIFNNYSAVFPSRCISFNSKWKIN